MEVVDSTPPSTAMAVEREMTRLEQLRSNLKYWLIRQRRKLPYLVWWNDELDVTVTLSQDKLTPFEIGPNDNPVEAMRPLFSGALSDIENTFHEMDITFDRGMGCEGRDWEWDWSLKGPISIRFHGRARRPELRMERPRPVLVATKPAA